MTVMQWIPSINELSATIHRRAVARGVLSVDGSIAHQRGDRRELIGYMAPLKHSPRPVIHSPSLQHHHHHCHPTLTFQISKATTTMPRLPLLPPAARPQRLSSLALSLTRTRAPPSRPSSSFTARPSPPKLPADQQAEFERLQRAAAVSSAFQQPDASSSSGSATPPSTQQPRHATNPVDAASPSSSSTTAAAAAAPQDADVNQGMFRGAPPEFEGDVNPKTGEVGGPKNEPLRWGGGGDWSYNGRVTDF